MQNLWILPNYWHKKQTCSKHVFKSSGESSTDLPHRYLGGHKSSNKHIEARRELEGTLPSSSIKVSKPVLTWKNNARAKVESLWLKSFLVTLNIFLPLGKNPVPFVLDIRQYGKLFTMTSSHYASLHLNYSFIIFLFFLSSWCLLGIINHKHSLKKLDIWHYNQLLYHYFVLKIRIILSSVKWTALGHILKNPKIQNLTPIYLLFFYQKLKNKNKSPQNVYLTPIFKVKN